MGSETGNVTTGSEGRVVGYEMKVECPYCGYMTDANELSATESVACGSDYPGNEEHGCGVDLVVDIHQDWS